MKILLALLLCLSISRAQMLGYRSTHDIIANDYKKNIRDGRYLYYEGSGNTFHCQPSHNVNSHRVKFTYYPKDGAPITTEYLNGNDLYMKLTAENHNTVLKCSLTDINNNNTEVVKILLQNKEILMENGAYPFEKAFRGFKVDGLVLPPYGTPLYDTVKGYRSIYKTSDISEFKKKLLSVQFLSGDDSATYSCVFLSTGMYGFNVNDTIRCTLHSKHRQQRFTLTLKPENSLLQGMNYTNVLMSYKNHNSDVTFYEYNTNSQLTCPRGWLFQNSKVQCLERAHTMYALTTCTFNFIHGQNEASAICPYIKFSANTNLIRLIKKRSVMERKNYTNNHYAQVTTRASQVPTEHSLYTKTTEQYKNYTTAQTTTKSSYSTTTTEQSTNYVTALPTTTTKQPTTRSYSTNTTEQPENYVTAQPTNTTAPPTNATAQPKNTTAQPTTTTKQPTTRSYSTTSSEQSTNYITAQPTNTTAPPTNATAQPTNTTAQPTTTTKQPTTTSSYFTTSTEQSTIYVTAKPTTTTALPARIIEQPATTSSDRRTDTKELTTPKPQAHIITYETDYYNTVPKKGILPHVPLLLGQQGDASVINYPYLKMYPINMGNLQNFGKVIINNYYAYWKDKTSKTVEF